MVAILYVKNIDNGNKVCCTLLDFDCDKQDTTLLKSLAGIEKSLNEEALKKGYVTGQFVAEVLRKVLGVHLVCDPDAHLRNIEFNIF